MNNFIKNWTDCLQLNKHGLQILRKLFLGGSMGGIYGDRWDPIPSFRSCPPRLKLSDPQTDFRTEKTWF